VKLSICALITGAAGFLGRYISRQFAAEGWRVVGVDRAPPEAVTVRPGATYHRLALPDLGLGQLLSAERPKLCVHCAGRASVPFSMEQPDVDFHDNTVMTFQLLDMLRRHVPGCRFVLLSSAAVYGNPESLPVSESHRVAPLSPYGFHKRQCEFLCEEFAKVYGLQTASVRIFSAYGPGLRRQVLWDICERILTNRELKLKGTGAESRDFIHAADVARALTLVARLAPCEADVYNLATGREITIRELAKLITTVLRPEMETAFDGTARSGDPRNWRADISKVQALGFAPAIPLEQGIRTVATWASAELAPR
jgi:UDP-glucose 4-epimerase